MSKVPYLHTIEYVTRREEVEMINEKLNEQIFKLEAENEKLKSENDKMRLALNNISQARAEYSDDYADKVLSEIEGGK